MTCAMPRHIPARGMTLRNYSSTSYEAIEKAFDPDASVQAEVLRRPAMIAVDASVSIIFA